MRVLSCCSHLRHTRAHDTGRVPIRPIAVALALVLLAVAGWQAVLALTRPPVPLDVPAIRVDPGAGLPPIAPGANDNPGRRERRAVRERRAEREREQRARERRAEDERRGGFDAPAAPTPAPSSAAPA